MTRPDRFLRRELVSKPGTVGDYKLRRSGRHFTMRHSSKDAETFHEVLIKDGYELPAAARALLDPAPRVLDLGGNVGMFGVRVLELWPQATIVSFEPDPENAALLTRTIALNGAANQWSVVNACAMVEDGPLSFAAGGESMSRIATETDETAITVAGVDVLPYMAAADLVKIDIEGAEWPLLSDPRFAQAEISALVLEYHPMEDRTVDTHTVVTEILHAAGYATHPIFRHPVYALGVMSAWHDRRRG